MNQDAGDFKPYDLKNFKSLMAEYKDLLTFEQVASWDQRAGSEVESIVRVIRETESMLAGIPQRLEQAKQEYAEENILTRLFSGRKSEKALVQLDESLRGYKTTLEGLASDLQEAIDFTPNSPADQASLLKELKARKKELQIKKREVAAEMKAIRTGATKQSAEAGMLFGGALYDRKIAATQRRSIRYNKEAVLRPHENAKSAIERQIIQIDRDVLRVEKISDVPAVNPA